VAGAPSRERHGQFPEVPSFALYGEPTVNATSTHSGPSADSRGHSVHRTGMLEFPTMPLRLFRILTTLTLALVVPIQGAAAATAGLCMALGHHDAGIAAAHDHASGHGAHHVHSNDSGAGHGNEASDSSPGGAHCPPCVACCAAAAISALPQIFIPEPPTASVIAAPELSFSGIQPEQLDRPPLAL
jgi:hypothetical protein